jgi:hypothetical protein
VIFRELNLIALGIETVQVDVPGVFWEVPLFGEMGALNPAKAAPGAFLLEAQEADAVYLDQITPDVFLRSPLSRGGGADMRQDLTEG